MIISFVIKNANMHARDAIFVSTVNNLWKLTAIFILNSKILLKFFVLSYFNFLCCCTYSGCSSISGFSLQAHVCAGHQCSACALSFTTEANYMAHLRLAHEVASTRSHQCDQCDREFPAASSLQYHRESVHKKAEYFCTVEGCNKVGWGFVITYFIFNLTNDALFKHLPRYIP